jgi:hypothetical protein
MCESKKQVIAIGISIALCGIFMKDSLTVMVAFFYIAGAISETVLDAISRKRKREELC